MLISCSFSKDCSFPQFLRNINILFLYQSIRLSLDPQCNSTASLALLSSGGLIRPTAGGNLEFVTKGLHQSPHSDTQFSWLIGLLELWFMEIPIKLIKIPTRGKRPHTEPQLRQVSTFLLRKKSLISLIWTVSNPWKNSILVDLEQI